MSLRDYFASTKGHGVLATADAEGKVNMAVYATPHFMDDGSIAFIMRKRLSHKNLQENPHAAYLFHEEAPGFQGKRFHLTKLREEQNTELLYQLRRRTYSDDEQVDLFLVFFQIDKELPLVGTEEEK